jgi:hypothetical protein
MDLVVEIVAAAIASCIAEALTLPLDTLKVRIQVHGGNISTWRMCNIIFKNEGIVGFFRGLEPALIRQVVYGGLRFGLYLIIQQIIVRYFRLPLSAGLKLLAAFLTGFLSSALCNPLDLVKLRMQASSRELLKKKTDEKVVSYQNSFDAMRQIAQNEGILALYTGVIPTTARATVLACVELSSYDLIKSSISQAISPSHLSDGIILHVVSALLTSLLSSFASNPFDMVKSRLMNQANGVVRYDGFVHCLVLSVHNEGIGVLWSGFLAYFMRLGPNTIITFVCLEMIRDYLIKFLRF